MTTFHPPRRKHTSQEREVERAIASAFAGIRPLEQRLDVLEQHIRATRAEYQSVIASHLAD